MNSLACRSIAATRVGITIIAAGIFLQLARPLLVSADATSSGSFSVSPNCRKWDAVTIRFSGPSADAAGDSPNPFLDYRLQVAFTAPGGKRYNVPGFFDGDGNGGSRGNVWRVLFSPDETGRWTFEASFRKGPQVAISLDPGAGEATAFHGVKGSFEVAPTPADAPGYLKWGRLEYVGKFYLKFRDGPYWIKGGTDEPEDFLAYVGFTNTPQAKHRYTNHVQDWLPGDPDWDGGKGKAIIGALNYLSAQHMNNLYFLPMNIGGDGKNVWPYLGHIDPKGSTNDDNLHFDLMKLRQWETVLDHAQRRSIFLHFVLNEAEHGNKNELDETALGVERKLYYRELIARFGHHVALQWNLCEEYNLDIKLAPDLIKSYAEYIHAVDPYGHPITVHHAGKLPKAWEPFLGFKLFPITSFQFRDTSIVEYWRKASRDAGWPQVVSVDELFPDNASPTNVDRYRREYTWPIYLSGGQIEYILQDLIKTDDFRKYEPVWRHAWHARKFLEENLPFWEMEPMDQLLTGAAKYQGTNNLATGQVFAKPGEIYAVYVPVGDQSGALDLSAARGKFSLRWYNPRTGEFTSGSRVIEGGKPVALGTPPMEASEDWAVLIERPK